MGALLQSEMVMSLIIPNLYMGSYEDASDLKSLSAVNIKGIVSIGCSADVDIDPNTFERLSYSDILDKPEQPILHIMEVTSAFVSRFLTYNSAVLVSRNNIFFTPWRREG